MALAQLARQRRLPEFVIEMTRDWVYGECAATGRSRHSLLAVLDYLTRHGTTPLSQAKLARESGLANNTVAAGYLGLLGDLLCLAMAYSWDPSRKVHLARRPAKHPFINLLAAVAWHPAKLRHVDDVEGMPPDLEGCFREWLVAQEIWRRRARQGDELPEVMSFWQSKEHEIDFVLGGSEFLEVKSGASSPLEFAWFARVFPGGKLRVINRNRFDAGRISGLTLEDFLLEEP